MDRRQGLTRALVIVAIAAASVAIAAMTHETPPIVASREECPPPTLDISGRGPLGDVTCNSPALFHNHSWRSFLALTWRADLSERGRRDAAAGLGDSQSPRIFETFKATWETFRGPASPGAWQSYPASPCQGVDLTPGAFVLSSLDKIGDVQQQSGFAQRGPLVAQNGTYVRYAAAYNRVAFEAIVRNKWYLGNRLGRIDDGTPASLPDGSIAVKSAWIEVNAALARPERYYRRKAYVRRLDASGICDEKEVALIGLHIIQKTAVSPQWIWSTFEHVDNVPPLPPEPDRSGPFALHDGSNDDSMPGENPNLGLPLVPQPQAINISRARPLSQETVDTNQAYRTTLGAGSIWSNYQLVMTQWPRQLRLRTVDGSAKNSIPGSGQAAGLTATANPALETYFQTPVENACMGCHNETRSESDFLWGPVLEATPNTDESVGALRRKRTIDALIVRLGRPKR